MVNPLLVPVQKTLETDKKQVFAEATREGTCLQNTEEEEEEDGGEKKGTLRGSLGGCRGGLTSFKNSCGSSVVVVDTVGPAP